MPTIKNVSPSFELTARVRSASSTLVPILIVAGMLIVGGVYLAYLMTFRPQVLAHEPGEVEVAANPEVEPMITSPTIECHTAGKPPDSTSIGRRW